MANYLYLDETKILHGTSDKGVAERQGKFIETDLQIDESGFPIVPGHSVENLGIIFYTSTGKAYNVGNARDGKEIPTPKVLTDLVAQLQK